MPDKNTLKQDMIRLGRPGGPHRGPMAGPVKKAKDSKSTLKRLWRYLRKQQIGLILVICLVTLATLLRLLGPYLIGVAIDRYIRPVEIEGLGLMVLLLSAIYIITALTTWLQNYVMADVSQQTIKELRRDLFAKLQTLSLRFFDRTPHGELMSRLTNDIENISNTLRQSVTEFISSVLTMTGVVFVMFTLNWPLALISLSTIPCVALITKILAKHTRKSFVAQQKDLGAMNGLIEETITGQKIVKLYGREQEVIKKFNHANIKLKKTAIRAQIFAGLLGPMMNMIKNLSLAVMVGTGGWMVVNGATTVGTIASFVNYIRQFSRPLNQIASLYNSIQSALAGAERVFEIMDEVPEVRNVQGAVRLDRTRGEVAFRHVNFGYQKDVPVLKDISLHAKPGQTIALVGPTGSGKTTIINLLTRFYDVDSGLISIDGQDIRNIRKECLRQRLGIVLQDTFLFAGTVKDNIRYGRLDATDREVEKAARLANADPFIRYLPQGYDTLLTEEGDNLSQGQRQLLAIARAILSDPDILILDEATSSVDTKTEIYIQKAMLSLMQGRTSFVIAHRLKTIQNADRILVIKDGKIIERGHHASLLDKKGFYYDLYTSQFQKIMPEKEYNQQHTNWVHQF